MTTKDKELKMVAKAADEFAKKVLASAMDEDDEYPFGEDLLAKAYGLDFFHLILPESVGGVNMGIEALCTLLESICKVDCGFGGIIFTTAFAHELIMLAAGTEVLGPMTSPDKKVEEFLVAAPVFSNPVESEPAVSARMKNGRYYLSGMTEYLVVGNIAAKGLIPAGTDGEPGYSYFLVDLTQKSISKGEPVLSLGMHSCPAVDVELEGAEGLVLGKEQKGEVYFRKASERFHIVAASMAVGVMKGSLREGIEYCRQREQGGRKILQWSEVQMILSHMALKTKLSEMALAHALGVVNDGADGWRGAALAAALQASEMACQVTTDGVQVLGGVGYMEDFGQEKRFRDARHIQNLLGAAPMKKVGFLETIV